MAKAKPIKVGNSGRKLVLMMLADISDDSGRCFPSYQHLADVCEMSRRSVITHISKLEEDGFLKVTHRKLKGEMLNSSNIYHLTLESAAKPDETCGENSALGSEMVALGGSEMVAPITYHPSYPIKEPIKTKARFIKPSLNDVSQYMTEYGKQKSLLVNKFLPDDFFDYYEGNGWKRGKHQMKDWEATARSWVRKQNNDQSEGLTEPQARRKAITANVLDIENTNW
jgi:biotin operon repressor